MDKNFYAKYFYLEREHWWFKARNLILEEHVKFLLNNKEYHKIRILNIGAGTGFTTEMLLKYGEVTSIEYNKECCDLVMTKTNIKMEHGDINDIKYKSNYFDLVTAFDVIEHIENDKNAVNELIRVTKKNGIIFTSVPAYNFLWTNHDIINHHFRRYTKKTFLTLWKKSNIKTIYSSYINFYLFPPILLIRLISKLRFNKKKEIKSDFETYKSSIFSKLLFCIFKSEIFYVRKKVSLLFGLSFLASFEKTND